MGDSKVVEWVHSTTLDPDGASLAWSVRSEGYCLKASVQCNGLVMFPMIEIPMHGETQNCIGIMSNFVDESCEVVVGTIERVVTLVVYRMPKWQ